MMDLKLALRNAFRNTRRTGLTLAVLALGVAVLIIFAGFIDNSQEMLREVTIKNQLGHLQLARRAYWVDPAGGSLGAFVIEDYAQIRRDLEGIPHVRKVAATLDFMGLLGNDQLSLAVAARGMDIDTSTDVSWNFPRIVAGGIKDNAAPNAGFLGEGLARGLKSGLQDSLVLLSTTRSGALNAVDIRVEGIVRTGSREYDNTILIVPLSRAQTLLNTRGAMRLTVFLDKTANVPVAVPLIQAYLRDRHPDVEVRRWSELATFYWQVVKMEDAVFHFLGLIIGAIATVSIVNTFLMSLFERVDEIGTLRAIGATRLRILRVFLAEGAILGVVGGIAGVALGVVLALLISIHGVYIPPLPTFNLGYQARINLVPLAIAKAFGLGVLTTVLACLYPAFRAARLNIIEAVRHV
jgi:putative ABC transport system permease protein